MATASGLLSLRETRPATAEHLRQWVRAYTGVRVARRKVCRGHAPPLEWLSSLWLERPGEALVLGSRGSGKSFLAAVLTHLESRFNPRLGTRVLGGSKAQSAQILDALTLAVADGRGPGGSDKDSLDELLKTEARYRNGSHVSILSATPRSVRGPHVPSLKLDEVDEIPTELREAAMGMCMATSACPRVRASVLMTSTWHRLGGPMSGLVERGRNRELPLWTTCTFDVLETCPESRSGPYVGGADLYERCPACPLVAWCHAERDLNGGHALAKLASGHYPVDSLAQKVRTVSRRAFEADYLCKGPKADGLWFKAFDRVRHVTEAAEYDPKLPVELAVDSGVFTGAVAFQVRPGHDGSLPSVTVFLDCLLEGVPAFDAAGRLLALLAGRDGTRRRVWTDPAGGARNPVGPTVLSEYFRGGLKTQPWPSGSVADSLAAVESLVDPAAGPPALTVHPRCKRLVEALENYRRAKRGGQWQDHPEDPQHPHEDLVDALRGGLRGVFPDGLQVRRFHASKPAHRIFH